MRQKISTASYLRLPAPPERIAAELEIEVSNHAYLPRPDDPQRDWIASVAAPALRLWREHAGAPVAAFCSIGTGSGLDALAAIEILGASRVGITDLAPEVVSTAAQNIAANVKVPLDLAFGAGDLLAPLREFAPRYDVIYENVPNVPAPADTAVAADRNSGHYLAARAETLPEIVKQKMLDLHYLALLQARDFLADGGVIFSTLGARVELEVFLTMSRLANYAPEIWTYTWKSQAEPEDVLAGHARQQQAGFGPFHFYLVDDLRAAFAGVDPTQSGKLAAEIERSLAPKRLDAAAAWREWQTGADIGHTVAVVKSAKPQ
jgi:methylase of polypeptide subunit release factors